MKKLKSLVVITVLGSMVALPLLARAGAGDAKPDKKPYALTTCVVSGDKLGGMGDPYVFTYKDAKKKDDAGREVKLCCPDCKKDFDKDPAKYLKKLDEAEAKAKK